MPDEAAVDGDDAYGALEDISGELPSSDDDYFDIEDGGFLASLGVPGDELDNAFEWGGWTAAMVRQAVAQMAKEFKASPEKVLAKAIQGRQQLQAEGKAKVKALENQVKDQRRRVKAKEERLRRERMLPADDTLQKVTRYEAHLSRQLYQALHELQRLQAARAGNPVPPPAALDITCESGGDAGRIVRAACGP
jgi:hypothetical protein